MKHQILHRREIGVRQEMLVKKLSVVQVISESLVLNSISYQITLLAEITSNKAYTIEECN
jgi:hypothetical protein